MMAVYLALFAYYYPCTHGIEDEVGFINQAVVMSRGAISAEGAGFDHLGEFAKFKGRHVNWRNPGRSFLILPFLQLGGLSAVFWSGAVIHVLLTLVAALIFARLGRSPLWAVLILCHPTLAIYSRTIMGDEPAALGLCCALLAFVTTSRPGLWAGAAIGLASVMRYQAGLTLPFFALAIWSAPHVVNRRRQACYCILSGGLVGVGLMVYNYYLFGNLLGWVNQGSFSLSFVPRNVAFYTVSLCVIWPMMFPALALDQSPIRWATRAICFPLFLLVIGWHAFDHHSFWAFTLVIGQRYLIPVLPAWVLSYTLCLERAFFKERVEGMCGRWLRPLVSLACLVLLAMLATVCHLHDAHLHRMRFARQELARCVPEGSLVIANYNLEKLFGVPSSDLPTYRWHAYEESSTAPYRWATIQAENQAWYLAVLPKAAGSEQPDVLSDYINRYHMIRVPTQHPTLILYKSNPPMSGGTEAGASERE